VVSRYDCGHFFPPYGPASCPCTAPRIVLRSKRIRRRAAPPGYGLRRRVVPRRINSKTIGTPSDDENGYATPSSHDEGYSSTEGPGLFTLSPDKIPRLILVSVHAALSQAENFKSLDCEERKQERASIKAMYDSLSERVANGRTIEANSYNFWKEVYNERRNDTCTAITHFGAMSREAQRAERKEERARRRVNHHRKEMQVEDTLAHYLVGPADCDELAADSCVLSRLRQAIASLAL